MGEITDSMREKLAADAVELYSTGSSIRAIAVQKGVSYGLIHKLLTENDVTFRPRQEPKKKFVPTRVAAPR